MPTVTLPVVPHRSHITVLEYLCDKHAQKRPALGHIFSALRSEITRLGEIISAPAWIAPTFEVIPAAPLKCKHGLREAWCATCAMLSRSSESKTYVNARTFSFQNAPLDITSLDWVESLDFLADEKAEEKRAVEAKKCAKAAERVEKTFVTPPTGLTLSEMFVSPLLEGRAWEEARVVRVAAVKQQTLAEYDALHAFLRHQNVEAATQPRCFTNFCPHCAEMVTDGDSVLRRTKGLYLPVEHECPKVRVYEGAAKRPIVTSEEDVMAHLAAMNLQRRLEVLKLQPAPSFVSLLPEDDYSKQDEEYYNGVLQATSDEAVKRFERDLSRKGNKYRIQ